MEEDEKTTANDLTEQEKIEEEDTGSTPEEAHREGEFDDLSDKLDKVLDAIDSMKSTLAVLVKSGAVTVDEGADDDDGDDGNDDDAPTVDEIQDLSDLDLTI